MNQHLQRALLLLDQSRHQMAEAEVRQALAVEPQDPLGHAVLALCLAQSKQFKAATDEARQAVHLGPDVPFVHYVHASVLRDRNLLAEALQAVTEAIRLDPEDPDQFALLGQIQLDQSRWQEALAAAERGLEADAEHVACANLRAIALVKLGRRAEAGATIDAALARQPDNALTHANRGWALLEAGEPQRAVEHFREALRLEPDNEWARAGIVEALKARHSVYALMLRYFLWMSRFGANKQWAIILGGYVGYRLLVSAARNNPALKPWVWPLQILYLLLVFLTWLADPLFNLVLRFNRFGRLALSREQTLAANCAGACLLAALICAGVGLGTGFRSPWPTGVFVFAFLALPVAGVFKCPEGWPRNVATLYAAFVGLAGVAAMATYPAATLLPGAANAIRAARAPLMAFYFLGIIASTWLINLLIVQRPKR